MAKTSIRALWAAKLSGTLSPTPRESNTQSAKKISAPSQQRIPFNGIVLGIDPSLRGTGLAVIEFIKGRPPLLLHCRTIHIAQKIAMPTALAQIHQAISATIATYKPTHAALEQTIYVQNFQTAQILGAARGAILSAVALAEVPVFEYPPLRMKQAVVGFGRASKEQVARTVMSLLGLPKALTHDEADAAGIGLCHAFTWKE